MKRKLKGNLLYEILCSFLYLNKNNQKGKIENYGKTEKNAGINTSHT